MKLIQGNAIYFLLIFSIVGSYNLSRYKDYITSDVYTTSFGLFKVPFRVLKEYILFSSEGISRLIEAVVYRERDKLKCVIFILDDSTYASTYIREIQTRIYVPVVILLLSHKTVINIHASNSITNESFTKTVASAINEGCKYNVIWVKFENTARKVAYLLRESAKLAVNRKLCKYVYIPQQRYLTNITVETSTILESIKRINQLNGLKKNSIKGTSKNKDLIFEGFNEEIKNLNHVYHESKLCNSGDITKYVFRCNDSEYSLKGNDMTSVLCLKEMDSIPDIIIIRVKLSKKQCDYRRFELVTNSFQHRYPNTTLQMQCEWNGTHLFPEDCLPFPDKLSNLHRRKVTISTFSWYFPYINVENMDGTENRLLTELANKLNFTITVKVHKHWGTFHANGTGKGIHSDLFNETSDIGIGGLLILHQSALYFDFTLSYLMNGLTMLVPRPKSIPLWLSIIAPFRISLWLLVIGSVLVGSLALYFCALLVNGHGLTPRHINIYADFIRCLLTVVGQLSQASTNRWPYEAPLRHLMTWQFIFFVIVATGYKSSLVGFLRNRRYEKTIDSAEDFNKVKNLYWTALDDSWPKLLASFSDSELQTIRSRYKRFPNKSAINEALHDGNLAIAVENLATGGYSGADYINKDFIASSMWLMTKDLSTTMVAMELQRGSPYAKCFDSVIQRLVDAGIIQQWEKLSWLYTDKWRKKLRKITSTKFGLIKIASSKPPVIITLSHLHGVFLLLSVGLCFSLVTFLIEISWRK